MPSDGIITTTQNFEELKQALGEAPAVATKYVKTPLFRFARRVARLVKTESLSGRPGIAGGPWRRLKDKNVRGVTVGHSLDTFKAVNRFSRIVRTHIEGATIRAPGGGLLTLRSAKTGRGTGAIFARVKSVQIPARVEVLEPWQREIPRVRTQVMDALHRAVGDAMDRRMKTLTTNVTKALTR
jgi:hypothetical protein